MTDVEFRSFEPGDEARIFEAYADLFEGDVDARSPVRPTAETFRWRQSEHPLGARLLLGVREGRVICLVSGCAQRVLVDGKEARFNRIDDLRIDPAIRRGLGKPGLLVRAGKAYADTYGGVERDLMMWGFPTPSAWRVGNWHLKADVVRTQFKLASAVGDVRIGAARGVEVERVERFPDEVDELFARFAEGRGVVGIRDAAHLNWRFAARPDARYTCALARRGGNCVGLTVFRKADFDGEVGVGLVCEWMANSDDLETANAMLAWLDEEARAAECERLVTLLPESSPEWRLLHASAGFLAIRLEKRFLLAFRAFNKRLRPHGLHSGWHYTMADTDFC